MTLNGRERAVPDAATVADVAALVGVTWAAAGTAVALDGRVVPRGEWSATVVADGARIEVVRAAAGG